jgi:hypothetical protein
MLVRENVEGYTGLYGFHKYWGKKPADIFRFLIDSLSSPHDLIVDPFVGSGVLAVESQKAGRRFLGIDINPIAVHISRLLVDPPSSIALTDALKRSDRTIRRAIDATYRLGDDRGIATHYLWRVGMLESVWTKKSGRGRLELEPTKHDYEIANQLSDYRARTIRPIRMFDNSRINTKCSLELSDLLTGRAQHNIDLIQDWINGEDEVHREALRGCLTSSIGQMSKMVFAITGRGKTNGHIANKIEVGSWVIGYWRPALHFEINVWNCFERRVKKLIKAIETCEVTQDNHHLSDGPSSSQRAKIWLDDARAGLRKLSSETVDLMITDPPHGDRIPYLELSEFWNAVLNTNAQFDNEIVVSNAKLRHKNVEHYQLGLEETFHECRRIVKPGGYVVILFNARDEASWVPVRRGLNGAGDNCLRYDGVFESHYSSGSVVQDNREGGLQYDYGLVFSKPGGNQKLTEARGQALRSLPGWSLEWPF